MGCTIEETPVDPGPVAFHRQTELQQFAKIVVDDEDEDLDDDEDDDDEDEEEDPKPKKKGKESDDDGDDEDDEDEKDLPEGVRTVLKKNRRATRNAEARAKRAERELASLKGGKPAKKPRNDDEDDESKEASIRADERSKSDARLKRSEGKAALVRAGLDAEDDDKLAKALRLLDLDELEVTDAGNVEGLRDQIVELKEDFPELFKKKRARRDINGADGGGGPKRKLSASERQAAQFTK